VPPANHGTTAVRVARQPALITSAHIQSPLGQTRVVRPASSHADVERALESLIEERATIGASFPRSGALVDSPGLYAWFVDPAGAAHLSAGLGLRVGDGLIYAGQTGANKWPSGRVGAGTLHTRIGSQHVRGRIPGSTFRLTLAAALRASQELDLIAPKRLSAGSEQLLSDWIADHLRAAICDHADRDTLADVEHRVLAALDPPLNLEGMTATRCARRCRARGRACRALRQPRSPGGPPRGTAAAGGAASAPHTQPTLHEELLAILTEHGNRWLTTDELAAHVNRRGCYHKRDGTPATALQIHGHTRNYPQLFERDGSRVRQH
jgi:hypothetical protein